ncbi:hypothetical protein BC777_0263 [Yoonia maricola]|uniref:HSP20 family molecular chaperone IbpA n=1 Tax=Yoonia maricola TaxID=420999 RepID=A0A2M8WKG3_9RHOB|nr:Hsp20/alpha crystallin family protein [Yoonia maricola]PJI91435.1 hypothetical protein BC777_0263 [Yoonia maricola]
MTDRKKSKRADDAKRIDDGLSNLATALGDAIGDIIDALKDRPEGEVARDHVIETTRGPVRAYAGVQFRVGGMDVTVPQAPAATKQEEDTTAEPDALSSHPLTYTLTESDAVWTIMADIPGVSHQDLNLERDETVLCITTGGARNYNARINIGASFQLDDIAMTLAHGVLTVEIAKGSQT